MRHIVPDSRFGGTSNISINEAQIPIYTMTVNPPKSNSRTSIVRGGSLRDQSTGRKVSLARQIAVDLLRQIESGELAPGQRLPWREDLCKQYGVSSITVRAALTDLTAQGRLESRWRGGIFVKERTEPLLTNASNTIALVAELGENPFSAGILAGAAECAHQAGFQVILAPTIDDPELEAKHID